MGCCSSNHPKEEEFNIFDSRLSDCNSFARLSYYFPSQGHKKFAASSSLNIISSYQLPSIRKNGINKQFRNLALMKTKNWGTSISKITKKLSNIKSLSFQMGSLGCDFMDINWKSFGKFSKLESLEITLVRTYQAKDCKPISFFFLRRMKNLKKLVLTFNSLGEEFKISDKRIPVRYLRKLNNLNISFHRSEIMLLSVFHSFFLDMKRIRQLDFTFSVSYIDQKDHIINWLERACCLNQVHSLCFILDAKDISHSVLEALTNFISNLQDSKNLRIKILNPREFNINDMSFFYRAISQNKKVESLELNLGKLLYRASNTAFLSLFPSYSSLRSLSICLEDPFAQESSKRMLSTIYLPRNLEILQWKNVSSCKSEINLLINQLERLSYLKKFTLNVIVKVNEISSIQELNSNCAFIGNERLQELEILSFPDDYELKNTILDGICLLNNLTTLTIREPNLLKCSALQMNRISTLTKVNTLDLGTFQGVSNVQSDFFRFSSNWIIGLVSLKLAFALKSNSNYVIVTGLLNCLASHSHLKLGLTFSLNEYDEACLKMITEGIKNMYFLEQFSFECQSNKSKITYKTLKTFINFIDALSTLRSLNDLNIDFSIGDVNLKNVAKIIAHGIGKLVCLRRLMLRIKNCLGQYIDPNLTKIIFSKICTMYELREFSISFGSFSLSWKNGCFK